jgi:NifB/MoaA-like Fe-S oxidoreductase
VGLTKHRKIQLSPVTRADAEAICGNVGELSDHDFGSTGPRRIFLADEFFIKAHMPIPPGRYYEDYPQIENGIGLIRQLLIEWKTLKIKIIAKGMQKKVAKKRFAEKKYLILTSVSAFAYVKTIMREMGQLLAGFRIDVMAVKNDFFGESVTVAGLLTARDMIKSSKPIAGAYAAIFIPAVMFNTHGYTMDGYSKARIEKQVGARINVVANLEEMVENFKIIP